MSKAMIAVGMGDLVVSADPSVELMCLGLGSCIAVCAYDAGRKIGAMVHVVLPSAQRREALPPGKYAHTAVPALMQELHAAGARLPDISIVLCGGAAIFSPVGEGMDIGRRNLLAVREALSTVPVRIVREEVGGRESRTLGLAIATGTVRLRTVRQGEAVVAQLGAQR